VDILKGFDNAVRTSVGTFDNERVIGFTARRDLVQNAAITVQAGVHILHAGVGMVSDAVIDYPQLEWPGQPEDMIQARLRLALPLLAGLVEKCALDAPVCVKTSLSPLPLLVVERSRIPEHFVTRDYLGHLRGKVGRNHWWTSSAFLQDGQLHIHGWAVPPLGWRGGLPEVTIDGQRARRVVPAASPWSDGAYWFLNGDTDTGFLAVGDCNPTAGFSKISVDYGEQDRSAGVRRFPVYQRITPFDELKLPLPPNERIHRVSGPASNQHSYVNGGKSDFERFRTLIAETTGRTDLAGLDVLDWGVGCGRLARYFIEHGSRVTGIDIDADNIAWCAANLVPARHLTVPLMPPTPLEDSSFDVIISSSVLSHLNEAVMRAWLDEISRLLRPDGVALLSFNGDGNSYLYGSIQPSAIAKLDGDGFHDEWRTPDLDGFIADQEYYRLTLMSSARARSIFQQQMRLEGVVLGVTSGHQDIAVLRKKAG
jgi:2-polyprenyl-3-methyl-5-hydroxy-6-metoxy-1,4-benzoquinol methylase